MSVFSRLTDVINANLHSLLDKSEEPEKMLRLMIEEMEQVQVEMRPRPPASSPNRNSWSAISRRCATRSRSGQPRPNSPSRRAVKISPVPPSPRSWRR